MLPLDNVPLDRARSLWLTAILVLVNASVTNGTATNPRTLYNFFPGRSADGMSIDVDGNLYASAGMSEFRGTSETLDTKTGVYVISPAGRLLKFIPIAEDLISNNGFGGPDMKTLFVTAGKTLFKVRTDVAGLPR